MIYTTKFNIAKELSLYVSKSREFSSCFQATLNIFLQQNIFCWTVTYHATHLTNLGDNNKMSTKHRSIWFRRTASKKKQPILFVNYRIESWPHCDMEMKFSRAKNQHYSTWTWFKTWAEILKNPWYSFLWKFLYIFFCDFWLTVVAEAVNLVPTLGILELEGSLFP